MNNPIQDILLWEWDLHSCSLNGPLRYWVWPRAWADCRARTRGRVDGPTTGEVLEMGGSAPDPQPGWAVSFRGLFSPVIKPSTYSLATPHAFHLQVSPFTASLVRNGAMAERAAVAVCAGRRSFTRCVWLGAKASWMHSVHVPSWKRRGGRSP